MKRQAFTLIEILVGAAISSVLAVGVFALMNAGMILSAKNLSLNLTSNSMRSALDRVEQVVQLGDTTDSLSRAQLINTSGTVVATGPAAGVKFDRAIGSPYVVTVSGGSIPSSTTSLTLTRSTHSVATAPVPKVGDVVRIATTAESLRPRIQSVTQGAISSLRQPCTVTFEAPLGTAMTVSSGTIVSARLIRNVAFLVMPAGGKPELRYYDSFDTTTNLNDSTKYVVVTDQIATASDDVTPFSLTTTSVNFSLRVRASENDRGMRGRQLDQFNTYNRTETLIRPKISQ